MADNMSDGGKQHMIPPVDQSDLREIPLPGGGRRIKLEATLPNLSNAKITIWLDSGSSASFVSERFVDQNKIKTFHSNFLTKMESFFGSNVTYPRFCIVTFNLQDIKLAIPAFIISSIPGEGDILIGMDQIGPGKIIGLNIPREIDKNISISLYDTELKRELNIPLILSNTELSFVNEHNSTSSQSFSKERQGSSVLARSKVEDKMTSRKEHSLQNVHDELQSKQTLVDHQVENFRVGVENYSHDSQEMPFVSLNGNESQEVMSLLIQLKDIRKISKLTSEKIEDLKSKVKKINEVLESKVRVEREQRCDLRVSRQDLKILIRREEDYLKALLVQQRILNREIKNSIKVEERQRSLKEIRLSDEDNAMKNCDLQRYSFADLKTSIPEYAPYDRETTMLLIEGVEKNRSREGVMTSITEACQGIVENIPMGLSQEVCNAITASMIEDDKSNSKSAEWREDHVESDNFKWLCDDGITQYHQLSRAASTSFLELKREFSNVLAHSPDDILMGQATLEGKPLEFDIELEDGKEGTLKNNPKLRKPYNVKKPAIDLLKTTLKEMEEAGVGILNPTDHDPEIASPAFFVRQKGKYRFCVDYRILNECTKNLVFPIPNMETILESLSGVEYISIIDLKSGYHQIKLSVRARKLASNITTAGIFMYKCLSFGLKNAPAFFQRTMNFIFRDLIGKSVLIYIDDIIIYSKSECQHLEDVRSVLKILRNSNFKANQDKCRFFVSRLRVLGRIISQKGIEPDPDLVKVMRNFPVPGSQSKIRSFLGLVGHYMHFIKDFQIISKPLRDLTHESVVWNENTWSSDPENMKSFEKLKDCLITSPILAFPDFSKAFYIQSDASLLGAGGILYQLDSDGNKHIVAYASWLFNETQRRYHTSERELLALIKCVKKWKPFFWGRSITIETDHQALKGVLKIDDPYGRISRWFMELSNYNYTIKYIPGVDNVSADTMSRMHEAIAFLESRCIIGDIQFSTPIQLVKESHVISQSLTGEKAEIEICLAAHIKETILAIMDFDPISKEEWIKEQRGGY
jgi:Reverse transcriptase (RNA-dependent DNA polymerase).